MELRQYQEEAIAKAGEFIQNGKRNFIVTLPTGAGKTVIFAEMGKRAISNGYSCLIITDSIKLHEQTSAYFDSAIAINAGSQRDIAISENSLYIAMAQTLMRRKQTLTRLSSLPNLIVIVDECHIKTACNPVSYLSNSIVLGFTATPQAPFLHQYFTEIYEAATISYLIENNYLARCEAWYRKAVNTSGLHIKKGEFDEEEQVEVFKTGLSGLLEDLGDTEKYKKALVFTSCIKHCRQVVSYLRENGLACCEVHSQCDELSEFYGDKSICISVGMLTKGFNMAQIDLIILFRKTASLPLFLQMCGRASRISDGKEKWRLIDYGGNIFQHGLWQLDRVWSIDPPSKRIRREECINGISLFECEICLFITDEKFDVCPKCGHERKEPLPEIEETVLSKWVDVNPYSLGVEDLHKYAIETKRKKRCIGIARSKGLEFLKSYAKVCGYSDSWVFVVSRQIYLSRKEPKSLSKCAS